MDWTGPLTNKKSCSRVSLRWFGLVSRVITGWTASTCYRLRRVCDGPSNANTNEIFSTIFSMLILVRSFLLPFVKLFHNPSHISPEKCTGPICLKIRWSKFGEENILIASASDDRARITWFLGSSWVLFHLLSEKRLFSYFIFRILEDLHRREGREASAST